MLRNLGSFAALVTVGTLGIACGSESTNSTPPPSDAFTSDAGQTVVVGDGRHGVFQTPAGGGCIQIGTECVKPQEKCGPNARADVIVDSTGKVVAIVCYPADAAPPVINEQGNVDLDKQNKGVVAVDGVNDGVDIAGDVSAQGNNVTVYGQGPDVSVIGGSVSAGGNNFALRGVTVQKNVKVEGNNATLVLCRVEGDLEIIGNNAVVGECTVFGKLTVAGQNAVLVANKVGGAFAVEGSNAICDGNVAFADANGDKIVGATELGAPLACNAK